MPIRRRKRFGAVGRDARGREVLADERSHHGRVLASERIGDVYGAAVGTTRVIEVGPHYEIDAAVRVQVTDGSDG